MSRQRDAALRTGDLIARSRMRFAVIEYSDGSIEIQSLTTGTAAIIPAADMELLPLLGQHLKNITAGYVPPPLSEQNISDGPVPSPPSSTVDNSESSLSGPGGKSR